MAKLVVNVMLADTVKDVMSNVRRTLLAKSKISEAKAFDKEADGKVLKDIIVIAKRYVNVVEEKVEENNDAK